MSTARRIVLLGLGHTNVDFVSRWIKDPLPETELVCISNFERSTYSGLFPSVLGLRRDPVEMQIDLKKLVNKADGRLIIGEVVSCIGNRLQLADGESFDFDAMSIGVGSMPQGLPIVSDSTPVLSIKPMQTFLARFHNAISEASKRRPTGSIRIVIVGGGVASIEIAFAISRWAKIKSTDVQITIVTAGDHPAVGMSERAVLKIEKLLKQREIEVITNRQAHSVELAELVLNDQSKVPSDLVIWATSATAPSILERLDLTKDERGFIAVDENLRSLSDKSIFAVGDCGTMISEPFPKAGVYAVRQSPILWHNLRATLAGETLQAFKPQKNFLKLINTGDGKALLEYRFLALHHRLCLWIKEWIDERFIREFRDLD